MRRTVIGFVALVVMSCTQPSGPSGAPAGGASETNPPPTPTPSHVPSSAPSLLPPKGREPPPAVIVVDLRSRPGGPSATLYVGKARREGAQGTTEWRQGPGVTYHGDSFGCIATTERPVAIPSGTIWDVTGDALAVSAEFGTVRPATESCSFMEDTPRLLHRGDPIGAPVGSYVLRVHAGFERGGSEFSFAVDIVESQGSIVPSPLQAEAAHLELWALEKRPAAFLAFGAHRQNGVIGTYCWQWDTGSGCADASSPLPDADALAIPTGTLLRRTGAGDPSRVVLWPAERAGPSRYPGEPLAVLEFDRDWVIIDAPPGSYVLDAWTTFEQGSAIFAFAIEVVPAP